MQEMAVYMYKLTVMCVWYVWCVCVCVCVWCVCVVCVGYVWCVCVCVCGECVVCVLLTLRTASPSPQRHEQR